MADKMGKTEITTSKTIMLRPTTKDLAKEAGVSRATVDRVLNGREGVKQKTVDRVNDAIKRLGFVRNIQAANLAKSQRYRFVFALPRSGDQFLSEIIRYIEEAGDTFAQDLIWCDVQQIDENNPHEIAGYLTTIDPATTSGVAIMAPETPQVRDAIFRLEQRGVAALPFISDQTTMKDQWVGMNNHSAGATAANLLGRFTGGAEGAIMIIAESMQSRDSLERRLGFDAEINKNFSNLRALPSLETYGNVDRAHHIIELTVQNNPDIIGVYVMSSEARPPLAAVNELDGTSEFIKIAHERTPFTEAELKSGNLDAIIAQDPGHLVRSAVRKLKASVDGRETTVSQERIRVEVILRTNL